jgi:hypothetical protein
MDDPFCVWVFRALGSVAGPGPVCAATEVGAASVIPAATTKVLRRTFKLLLAPFRAGRGRGSHDTSAPEGCLEQERHRAPAGPR